MRTKQTSKRVMSGNQRNGEVSPDQCYDEDLSQILNNLYDSSFPDGVLPSEFFQDISEDIAAHSTISAAELSTLPLADAPDVLLVDYGYEDISPCSSPTQYVCGQSDHSLPAECSPDRLYEPDQVPSSSYGPITSSEGTNFRVPGRGVKRLRDVYGEYDAINDNQLHYPDEEQSIPVDQLCTSDYHEAFGDAYRKRIAGSHYMCSSPSVNSSEYTEQNYAERELEIFLDSQAAVLCQVNDSVSESSNSNEDNSVRNGPPLFDERDLHRLSYDTLRSINRNVLGILGSVAQPLTYQQMEEITSESQRDVVTILHRILDQQNQHTNELRNTVEFFGFCHGQLLDENRQTRNELLTVHQEIEQVRIDQQMLTIALSLISERLNVVQRMLRELYDPFMRR